MEKILKQTGVCVIILLVILVLQSLNIGPINKGLAVCAKQLSQSYSIDEIVTFGTNAVETLKGASAVVVSAVISPAESPYGQPIDEVRTSQVSAIYAVSGGTVIAVGEDETLGQYVKIAHGNEAESVYGQCSSIYVQPLERVKKGQIIAEYENENKEEFYYTLSYLK